MGKKDHGTKLADLPDDSDDEIDSTELAALNSILNIKKKSPEEYNSLKYVMYATAIFLMLSLPFTDRILELALPMANSWLILVGLKTIIFFIVYYIVFFINKK
uniref:Uncharacterized protein n=1 Tax=Marseillevirus LCMAC201 TaxID=2506605 RepID=A0A481YWV1_9VIRU|nr:MAG: uncharacterized protein LCMAC201_04100 [Marseillevirus LCMAC201]